VDKIKTIFLIDKIASRMGGTEKQLLGFLSRIDRSQFEPVLVNLSESDWPGGAPLPYKRVVLGYRGFLKPGFPGVLLRLRRLIKEEKADVLHAYFEESIIIAFLATLFLRARPVLVSSRRDVGLDGVRPWYFALFKALLPVVNAAYDAIAANCEAVKRHAMRTEGVGDGKVHVIHNGVDTDPHPAPTPQDLGGAGPVRAALVANPNPTKRIDLLLEAAVLLKRDASLPPFQAFVFGHGRSLESLKKMADDLGLEGVLRFMGSVPVVSAYLARMDMGLLCSDKEGLSNALLEYLVHGLPVVATDAGGNGELVDASNGFLIPTGNARALADAMKKLIMDEGLRKKLGARSREKVLAGFSWEKAVREQQNLYRALLAARAVPEPVG
jgi:glycosyltransferase involved in cell wall biosynthesis